MQIPKIKTKLIITGLGVTLMAVAIPSSAFLVLNNRKVKPTVEGVSIVSSPTPLASIDPTSTTSPTPKATQKPVPVPTIIPSTMPTPSSTVTQTTQLDTSIASSLAKDAACKSEADIKKNEFINQAYTKLRTEHPEFYDYDAAVAKDPGKYSSKIDPNAAFKFWLSEAKILSAAYESDIKSTGAQLYGVYYAQCLSK